MQGAGLGAHLVCRLAGVELQERGHRVAEQQQDAGAHIHGPVMVGIDDQHVGAGAVGGGHEVLETKHPAQKRRVGDCGKGFTGTGWAGLGQGQGGAWGEPSPGPDAGRWESGLGERRLVAIEADEMAGAKAAHHDAECVEAQGADGKVTGPPGANGQEEQEVDTGEG